MAYESDFHLINYVVLLNKTKLIVLSRNGMDKSIIYCIAFASCNLIRFFFIFKTVHFVLVASTYD